MKKLFTLAMAACFGLAANAQDTSGWKEGQDVTALLNWKAYDAADEDPANPAWQGFKYGESGEWEFRPAGTEQITSLQTDDANNNQYFMCWGVYNLPPVDVYQEFTMPAGVYTVSVAGCYRHGQDGVTLDLFKAGEKTENCFVYVQVGDEVYKTPMMYKFNATVTEPLGASFSANDWGNEAAYTFNGTTIYSPQSHCAADWYIEKGKFDGNDVLFVVPEDGATVRVGISKPIDVAQDQIWWNHWKMTFESPYNDAAKAMVAYNQFLDLKQTAIDFADRVIESYGTLGAIMQDEIMNFEEANDISKNSSLEEIQAAMVKMTEVDAANRAAFTKTQTMEIVIDVCEDILKITDFAGKADLEAAVKSAKDVLYDTENIEATVADYLDVADKLNKARIAYLLTQTKSGDGSYDFTHAISFPWFVNQEYTPTYNGSEYVFPEAVESTWFGSNAPDDETDLETAGTDKEGNPLEPIADKAHWSTSPTAEAQWVYQDKWSGWHGGMKNCIQKLKGYAGFYSGWSESANSNGGMWVTQVLNDMPEGLYTLEGYVFSQEDGYETDGNQYMFMNDAEDNELVRVKNEVTKGFWGFWSRQEWAQLKTDYFYVPGGKVTVGYHHNSMAGNAGMTLKYYGKELDYSALMQNKINENAPAEGELWAADQKTYEELVAKIVYPIADLEAYNAALELANEAINFKNTAAAAVRSYNLIEKYSTLIAENEEREDIADYLETALNAIFELGDGENDSYKDIAPATDIFNAYSAYTLKCKEALSYNTDKLNALVAEQVAALKANYASVETLAAYERALSTPINEAIFNDKGGANASDENPIEVTELLVNPSLADGPKTGWTCVGEDVNPSINTYGRELAECWNQKPFTISQTLRSLPAGNYEIRVRACYRDGGSVDASMVERAKNGEGQNAFLFAETNGREERTAVVSTAAGEWTTPSFDKWWNAQGSEEAKAAGYMEDWDGTICILPGEETVLNDDDLTYVTEIDLESPSYPFDTKVGSFYYPSSMAGFKLRISATPDAYVNTVSIYVEEGADLTLGFKKIEAVGQDWLIYDDFQLFFKGGVAPLAIDGIDAAAEGKKAIFNLAGQRLAAPQKGFNIINGKKVYVK